MGGTKKILLLLLVVFIIIQFIQPPLNKGGRELAMMDISKTVRVPESVDALLKKACDDCHSNNSDYPWYAYVQPVGWLLYNHIRNGKQQLNFSEFGAYSQRRQQHKLKSIASQVNNDEMPLSSYTWIHKNAKLSKDDKALIISWATKAEESVVMKK